MSNKKSKKPEECIENLDYDIDNEDNDKIWHDVYYRKTIDELSNIYNSLDEVELVKESNSSNSESLDEAAERLKLDSEVIHEFTDNMKEDRKLRKGYAVTLIIIFIVFLIAYHVIFILCGCGILKYNNTTLNIFTTGGIIEVIALLKIIVGYLFKDNISEPLKNVLEKNKSDK